MRIGCSGWSYDSWRGTFYPERLPRRRWLEFYATRFDTVEVNASFYRLPTAATVEGWVAQVPPGFLFAVKASRYLTHVRRLREVADGWTLLRERIDSLARAGLLGPILWQLPANFARDDARLEAVLGLGGGERHAMEFRHPSWFVPEVLAMMATHGMAVAVGDDPRRPLPVPEPVADLAYLRLHRGRRGRRGRYSLRELDAWAAVLVRWRRSVDGAFVYLNNDWESFAVQNARELAARLPQ
jgi:uncharacterized protein YecE (DUF72 family)